MKLFKIISALPIAFSFVAFAHAESTLHYNVPFYHVQVKAKSKIHAHYKFDAHSQILLCRTDSDNHAISSIEWEYKDVQRKLDLPVFLKDDARFDGFWADPSGMLTITNEFGGMPPDTSIYVSCHYLSGY